MTIRVKRAYAPPTTSDGVRFLVDHLWPRGVKKEALHVERWLKSISPSNELRSWFGHEPGRWEEFQRRYHAELDGKLEAWTPLLETARAKDITLVFGARDVAHNNAVALQAYLEKKLVRPARDPSRAIPRRAGRPAPRKARSAGRAATSP